MRVFKGLNGTIISNSLADTSILHRNLSFTGKSTNLHNDLVSFYKLDEASGTRYDSIGSNDLLVKNPQGIVPSALAY